MTGRTARLFPYPEGQAAARAGDVPARPVILVFAIVFGGTLAALLVS